MESAGESAGGRAASRRRVRVTLGAGDVGDRTGDGRVTTDLAGLQPFCDGPRLGAHTAQLSPEYSASATTTASTIINDGRHHDLSTRALPRRIHSHAPPRIIDKPKMTTPTQSVQCFGKKKTGTDTIVDCYFFPRGYVIPGGRTKR